MKRSAVLILIAMLFLSGCSARGKSYIHVIPHSERAAGNNTGSAPAENYDELRDAFLEMVHSGTETGVIYTVNMEPDALEKNMGVAIRYVEREDPIGAYAVESVTYEVGTTGGKTAVAVSVVYRHSGIELKKILHLNGMSQLEKAVSEALEDCRAGVVMLVKEYSSIDFTQLVQDIARRNPQYVMEIPEVSEGVYGTGTERIVELSFSYGNSRDVLRQMQLQVRPVFDSAALYVSVGAADVQKFSQLYAFLMERFEYTFETSITPAYSLLCHGVGDSRAFAMVYAAMCSRAGLDCGVVTGARNGDPWTWNIICDDGNYYHVDLLASNDKGYFQELVDAEMNGYVWDYSAYPECVREEIPETE